MTDADRYRLLFGPYHTPRLRYGDALRCELRGELIVTGLTDAPVPWPLGSSNVEDERRLFYVAVTRATSNLIVSFVRYAVRSKVEPSQFIAEMGLNEAEEKRAKALS